MGKGGFLNFVGYCEYDVVLMDGVILRFGVVIVFRGYGVKEYLDIGCFFFS